MKETLRPRILWSPRGDKRDNCRVRAASCVQKASTIAKTLYAMDACHRYVAWLVWSPRVPPGFDLVIRDLPTITRPTSRKVTSGATRTQA